LYDNLTLKDVSGKLIVKDEKLTMEGIKTSVLMVSWLKWSYFDKRKSAYFQYGPFTQTILHNHLIRPVEKLAQESSMEN
jgi:hypothetical protein